MTLGTPLISPEFRANGRIEIYGQHGLCDGSDVTVARAMPAILEGRLSTTQWNKFCDDLDTALKPAAKMRKAMLITMIVLPIIFIVLTAISFITFAMQSQNSFNNFPNNNDPPNVLGSFIFMIIGAVVTFGGIGILICVASKTSNSISKELRKACDEMSARHVGISFHVRYESRLWSSGYGGYGGYDDGYGYHRNDLHVSTTQYIEVYVADAGNNNLEVPIVTATTVAPSAPPKPYYDPEAALGSDGQKKKSPAERMRELDQMKGLLSDEEYQRKRAEIMSDV